MSTIDVKITFYALDKVFNITTEVSANTVISDLFNLPGIVLPRGYGIWAINGIQVEESSSQSLSECVCDNKAWLTLTGKCGAGCMPTWDVINCCWKLAPVNC